ncbi:ORF6C domain-containing protein [Aliarcobacter cryaerophilus]|uniref:ORF6C domain-containing protein n=1 Tax=Aliarcobacter cryaerophilus TaxID=28198 RepID=UPI0008241EED|nr:ORF6C domain-containing protein [Aliarcobacter cryaerophilus]
MSANPINTSFIKDEIKITLKEITDLISVEHNKAMKTVDKLTLEASFGTVEKTATVYNDKGQTIPTYFLTKKQAIAVGAKLNNTLLMKIVDRLEELESSNKPKSTLDLIIQSAQKMQQLEHIQLNQENRLILLEENRRLENWQERALLDAKNKLVYRLASNHNLENDELTIKSLHSRVWKKFKIKFNIPRYNELPSLKFNDGLEFINKLTFGEVMV